MFNFYLVVVVLCSTSIYNEVAGRLVPFTPCPKLFNYFESQTWEIFGAMTFDNDLSGRYELEVNMSIPMDTDKNIVITRRTEEYKIQNGESIEYYVHFPYNHTFPKLTSVVFNGKLHCVGPPEVATADHGVTALSTRDSLTTRMVDILRPAVSTPPAFIQIVINNNNVKNHPECGINVDYRPLIFSGASTKSGEYPWLVAMFLVHGVGGYTFTCAGNLVSAKHVITAAHCTRDVAGKVLAAEDFVIVLGKHDIKNWVRGSTIRGVKEYYVHPDYRRPADADVAMLVLDEPVGFSLTIKPVCLWDESSDKLEDIVDKKGTVAGWGWDETGKNYVEEPKQIELPIVSQETCLRSDTRYLKLTSSRTFCAGYVNEEKGPCSGDSGSGFLMRRNGIWKLRGIVSIALLDSARMCDVNNYVVFSDVPKYTAWIQKVIDTI